VKAVPSVRLEYLRPGVAVITFDRPPVNAFDPETYDAAAELLCSVDADPDLRVLVLTGVGERAFTAGTDTASLSGTVEQLDHAFVAARRFFSALGEQRRPIVGALNGPAIGGGLMIASSCDVLLACPAAYLSLPELQLGLPGGGAHLFELVPRFLATRMLLLGERLSAQDALALGILHRVVPRTQLLSAALSCAEQIAGLDPEAVGVAREVTRRRFADAALSGYATEMAAMERRLRRNAAREERLLVSPQETSD